MIADSNEIDAKRRRKLLYRANHRGMKELDLILGGYVRQHIDGFSNTELDELERIIIIPDSDLLDWITRKIPVPNKFKSRLLSRILAETLVPASYTQTS